jgi:hypothetical protein
VEVKDAITIPTAASQLRKHPATPLSSTDNRQILKKNKTEDSPDRKEIRERVVKAKEKQAKYLNNLRKKVQGNERRCTRWMIYVHLQLRVTSNQSSNTYQ